MADSRGFANHRENDSRWQTGVFAMGQVIAVRTVDSCEQEHQRKIAQIVASPPSRPAPAGRHPNRPARNNAWTEARRRPLQWPIAIARRPASVMLYRRTSITLPSACTLSAATAAHPTRKNSATIFAVISLAI